MNKHYRLILGFALRREDLLKLQIEPSNAERSWLGDGTSGGRLSRFGAGGGPNIGGGGGGIGTLIPKKKIIHSTHFFC